MDEKRKRLKEIHDAVPPDYYDTSIRDNPFQRFWHRSRVAEVSRLISGSTGTLLDIGCGGGAILEMSLKGAGLSKAVGVDASSGAVAYAKAAHPSASYVCADFFELPFRDSTFSSVTAIEVLEHLPEPSRALSELHRCLKKGGSAVIIVPNERNILFRVIWYFWTKGKGRVWKEAHVQKFTLRTLKSLVESSGFKDVQAGGFLLGMLISLKAVKA